MLYIYLNSDYAFEKAFTDELLSVFGSWGTTNSTEKPTRVNVDIRCLKECTYIPSPTAEGHTFSYWLNTETNERMDSIPEGWDGKCEGEKNYCTYNLKAVWDVEE